MTETFYTKDHEWARLEGDIFVCGITEYAQKLLGDVVYVELPEVGRTVKRGEQVGVVETAKAASEVYSPLSGDIFAINDMLASEPGIINSSLITECWFFKVKSLDKDPTKDLMDEAAYQKYFKGLRS